MMEHLSGMCGALNSIPRTGKSKNREEDGETIRRKRERKGGGGRQKERGAERDCPFVF